MAYVAIGQLKVDEQLRRFVEEELLPRLDFDPNQFWQRTEALLGQFTVRNSQLLAKRDDLQQQIDAWHKQHTGMPDPAAYQKFLTSIAYLTDTVPDFEIDTAHVDVEISTQAGPQLVVPVKNARFALNAANARWGSLYDALYGTDAIPEKDGAERAGAYNPIRGAKVIAFVRDVLDQACPLESASHRDVTRYSVADGELTVTTASGYNSLQYPDQFKGFKGSADKPSAILLQNNRLHLEIQIDPDSEIGGADAAAVKDVCLEAAITTIQDCEDSVAAVDAEGQG
jgi:malate synthase